MSGSIAMTAVLYDELLQLARRPDESAAVLLAQLTGNDPSAPRLVVTGIVHVPEDSYADRGPDRLEIISDGYMHALSEAARTGSLAIWLHTHPGTAARTAPSRHDLKVNGQLCDLFTLRSGPDAYAWLVIGHDGTGLTFTGAIEPHGADPIQIDRLTSVGSGIRRTSAQHSSAAELPALFDRNIRALGFEVQKVITDMTFAMVGCGGTGSAVAEQMVRLGARKVLLIDPDELSDSNVTRVYGSTPADAGRAKVDILGDHLLGIAPDLILQRVQGSINSQEAARRLLDADVVFGCTDDNAGRLRLSRLPYYYNIMVIDCGVQLESDAADIINGIFGRVTVAHPGAACLLCRGRIDTGLAESELRDPAEQDRLVGEQYAPALPGVEPALVPFTTMVAAYAVSELIERLIGYGESPTPSEILLRVHDRTVSANSQAPSIGHYCDPETALDYDAEMLLGMNWTY